MLTRLISFDDGEYSVRITLRAATILDGAIRSILVDEGLLANRALTEEDKELATDPQELARRLLHVYAFPNCVAALESVENSEGAKKLVPERPTFEQFIKLPQRLFLDWSDAALKLNPQWRLEEEEIGGEEAKKEEGGKSNSP